MIMVSPDESDMIDRPCTVFLTTHAVYFDVRPDTSGLNDSLMRHPYWTIRTFGTGMGRRGEPRMGFTFGAQGETDQDKMTAAGMELAPGSDFSALVRRTLDLVERTPGLTGQALADAVHHETLIEETIKFDLSRRRWWKR